MRSWKKTSCKPIIWRLFQIVRVWNTSFMLIYLLRNWRQRRAPIGQPKRIESKKPRARKPKWTRNSRIRREKIWTPKWKITVKSVKPSWPTWRISWRFVRILHIIHLIIFLRRSEKFRMNHKHFPSIESVPRDWENSFNDGTTEERWACGNR